MNVLYIGSVVRKEEIDKYKGGSIAGNKMQYNILKYLSRCDDVSVTVLSFLPFQVFPFEKKIFVESKVETWFGNTDVYFHKYINLPYLKDLSSLHNKKHTIKNLDKNTIILCFNAFSNTYKTATYLSKKYGCKVVCLLADTTFGDCSNSKNIFKKMYYKKKNNQAQRNINSLSYVISLNKEALQNNNKCKKSLNIPGGIDMEEFCLNVNYSRAQKNIVYAGALTDYSGILTLIKAMDFVKDENVVLEIYGNGGLKNKVIELSSKKRNVNYLGTVSNSEMLKIQKASWCLINPRPVGDSIAQVTFPSKIFEYLMSGRPVISTRLNGFDIGFKNYIIWADDSPSGLSKAINQLSNIEGSEIVRMTEDAKKFIVENYSWEINIKKIVHFIKAVLGDC